MQILLLQESKLDCRLVVVGSRTSVISLTPPLLVRRSLVSIRPKNGQKRSEKHLSRFHFHIFLSDGNETGMSETKMNGTYSVSQKRINSDRNMTVTVGNW
jgi:hypothetical protein